MGFKRLTQSLFFFVWHRRWCWSHLLGILDEAMAYHWAIHWLYPMSIKVHYRTKIVFYRGMIVECKIRLEDIFNTIVVIILLPFLSDKVGGFVWHLGIRLHWIDRSILEHLCKTWQNSLPLIKRKSYAVWNHWTPILYHQNCLRLIIN